MDVNVLYHKHIIRYPRGLCAVVDQGYFLITLKDLSGSFFYFHGNKQLLRCSHCNNYTHHCQYFT